MIELIYFLSSQTTTYMQFDAVTYMLYSG